MNNLSKDFKFIPAILTSFDAFATCNDNDGQEDGFDVGAAEFIKAILKK